MITKNLRLVALSMFLAFSFIMCFVSNAQNQNPEELLARADNLFDEKNYRASLESYSSFLKIAPEHDKWHYANERIIICNLRLELFDDALKAAEDYIQRCKNTPYEARAERLCGNLYMLLPHWGTRAGGVFYRGQHKQGIWLQSYAHDKKQAIQHMERARTLYAEYDKNPILLSPLPEEERNNWHNERIECIFELAGIYSRFSIYENRWVFWYGFWSARDEFIAETAGEEDFDEYHNEWELQRKRPIGLRLDSNGEPIFPTKPASYMPDLSDDEKILYLLDEIRSLDTTDTHHYTALSYYRQAMLAQTRFGMERLNQYAVMYNDGGKMPIQEELKQFNPWDLKEDEALVLAGGSIQKVVLPPEWNIFQLLRLVAGEYKLADIADDAQYAIGIYYQSRQQYISALKEYARLQEDFPQSDQINNSQTQIDRIKKPEVSINPTGVQLPGEPARVQISYRNTDKLWFIARRIDAEGFVNAIRNEPIEPEKGLRGQWLLHNWHTCFAYGHDSDDWMYKLAAEYLEHEYVMWSDNVTHDGTHRYAEKTIQTLLDTPGAYLIYAFVEKPSEEDLEEQGLPALKIGMSRAVTVISDISLVEKKVKDGNLYFICNARTGAPIPNAAISVLETWSEWNEQKRAHLHYKEMRNLSSDENGFAVLQRPKDRWGNLHVLVKAGDNRLAWTGMTYWGHYYPSIMQDGMLAYCITDRPVYRPEQTVRFKVWLRHMRNGNLENLPDTNATVNIYDTRGNVIYTMTKRSDQFGGFDDEYTLNSEAALGVYRIEVVSARYVGGQNFRVEEYKKPEFEVTVEPSVSHAKLGEKIDAVIKATYYFGAPVTEATVQYKIFRQEYRHSYFFPGLWDWLYGPGYGLVWYDYDWLPWWNTYKCCRSVPAWWWGYYGGTSFTPVRELIEQGEAPIGEDGTLKVSIDSAPALRDHPDRDHEYIIQAEVRDASRRVITGEGSVKVTRQAYYTYIQSDKGYYTPGEEMLIKIRCITPGGKPVQTEGVVTISTINYGGTDNAVIDIKEVEQGKASTDESGYLEFRIRHEKSGQLQIKFESPDSWGGIVEGYSLVWIAGKDFDGSLYRFNNLEIITDKRTYQPGETAHVMINTKHVNSYVLFSDNVDSNHLLSWNLLHLSNGHMIIDIPITREHRPNFFIEGTTVVDTRVHQQSGQICVPPEEGIMNITVEADKPEYKPGEKATVKVTARTLDGKPIQAQIALSVFDKSVLYIQPEYGPEIAEFFHGRKRYHNIQMVTNLTEIFSAWSYLEHPFRQLYHLPPSWHGIWGPAVEDWRFIEDNEFKNMLGVQVEQSLTYNYPAAVAESRALGSVDFFARDAVQGGFAGGSMVATRAPMAKGKAPAPEQLVEPTVRKQFADTAAWLPSIITNEEGTAQATFDMPENLTTWNINAWGMSPDTKVGKATTSAITTKNLLVRLQAPRFFMEYDEVVISANIHNYLEENKTARVSLEIPEELMNLMGETPPSSDVEVMAQGEARVDWRVKILKEGSAKITVKALTDEESDAMQMIFPVLVHGITKQVATTGSIRPDEVKKTVTVEIDIPEKRRPELSRLEVQYAPSLVGAMLDALPYCIYYPYGCTEQTMSRFVPCLLTRKTLQNLGINLEDVRQIRGRLDEIRRIEKGEHLSIYAVNPIFDEKELDEMIQESLMRITSMQHGDGGWGWWITDESSPYLTSYVVWALCTAQQCDLEVNDSMIQQGMEYLKRWEIDEMQHDWWRASAQHAFVAYVLSLKKQRVAYDPPKEDTRSGDLIERLFADRDGLELYGKALLAMAMGNLEDPTRAKLVLQNIMQYLEENKETNVVWFRTPRDGWWYWWNSDIETNATILRAIVQLEPTSEVAPKLVKWLLNNRRNGYYWRSTRDTTLCIAAMSDFAIASGEADPDLTLTLDFDNGSVLKTIKINKQNFFTYDNTFVLEGVTLTGGKHSLKITKEGTGALYYSTYLRYFTQEENITAAGLELKVDRTYFKLKQIPYEVEVEGSKGQKIKEKRLRYERIPLRDGDTVESGDIIQVELRVASDNDYTYLCVEDMKPAGCEPTEVTSGGKGQEGFWSYMELRDEKVVFFVNNLGMGEHLMRHRLRAEIPGIFHALPTVIYGMYVPELRANSNKNIITIVE